MLPLETEDNDDGWWNGLTDKRKNVGWRKNAVSAITEQREEEGSMGIDNMLIIELMIKIKIIDIFYHPLIMAYQLSITFLVEEDLKGGTNELRKQSSWWVTTKELEISF